MKKMNNKGFSLVELIIVIAIMAILIAVLAPQFLRYVEKSRLQSDNSALGEVANAVKVAVANDAINKEISVAVNPNWTATATPGAVTFGTNTPSLNAELAKVLGTSVVMKSNTYINGTMPQISISIDGTDKTVTVKGISVVTEMGKDAETVNY